MLKKKKYSVKKIIFCFYFYKERQIYAVKKQDKTANYRLEKRKRMNN